LRDWRTPARLQLQISGRRGGLGLWRQSGLHRPSLFVRPNLARYLAHRVTQLTRTLPASFRALLFAKARSGTASIDAGNSGTNDRADGGSSCSI